MAKSVSEESTVLLPCDQCLFCDKKAIKKRGSKELPTKTFTEWSHKSSDWQNIEKMTTEMQSHGYSSLLRKVDGIDLFAAKTHFHPSYYHKFHSKYQSFTGYNWSKNAEAIENQEVMLKAHVGVCSICESVWNMSIFQIPLRNHYKLRFFSFRALKKTAQTIGFAPFWRMGTS